MTTAPRRTPPKGVSGPRSRRVPPPRGSFIERNRRRLILAGLAAIIAIAAVFAYASFTTKAYTCLSQWTPPNPAPTTAPSATPHIGYFQDFLGRTHVETGARVRYAFCPPASGQHYIGTGVGPIDARLYGPNEKTLPQGWIHNLEHGALVLLYRCGPNDRCDDSQQASLKDFYASFPPSPVCAKPRGFIGPVITRFDDMAFPYAALVWDEILPLDAFDANQILAFFAQNGEQTAPELQCAAPTPTPGPTGTPAPTVAPTVAPTTPSSPVPSAVLTPGPSAT